MSSFFARDCFYAMTWRNRKWVNFRDKLSNKCQLRPYPLVFFLVRHIEHCVRLVILLSVLCFWRTVNATCSKLLQERIGLLEPSTKRSWTSRPVHGVLWIIVSAQGKRIPRLKCILVFRKLLSRVLFRHLFLYLDIQKNLDEGRACPLQLKLNGQ